MPYVVDRIVAQGLEANKGRVFIPTGELVSSLGMSGRMLTMLGFQSKELIIKAGLVLGDVDQYPYLDVTIDGADE